MHHKTLLYNGGPGRNAKGQVMGVDEKPIERLYSAGSLGHIHGQVFLYLLNGLDNFFKRSYYLSYFCLTKWKRRGTTHGHYKAF